MRKVITDEVNIFNEICNIKPLDILKGLANLEADRKLIQFKK